MSGPCVLWWTYGRTLTNEEAYFLGIGLVEESMIFKYDSFDDCFSLYFLFFVMMMTNMAFSDSGKMRCCTFEYSTTKFTESWCQMKEDDFNLREVS